MLCTLLFKWVKGEYDKSRERKNRRLQNHRISLLEAQSQDEIDGGPYTQSTLEKDLTCYRTYANRLMHFWAYFELFLMIFVLCRKTGDFPDNFLKGLCEHGRCQGHLIKMIAYKILTSVLLAFGAKYVSKIFFFSFFFYPRQVLITICSDCITAVTISIMQ